MTLNADFDSLNRASGLVSDIEQALSEEKSRMQSQIDELTSAGWVGEAADQYARAWAEWVEAADRVLAALQAESRLLAQHRNDLMGTDGGVTGDVTRLHGRLGPS